MLSWSVDNSFKPVSPRAPASTTSMDLSRIALTKPDWDYTKKSKTNLWDVWSIKTSYNIHPISKRSLVIYLGQVKENNQRDLQTNIYLLLRNNSFHINIKAVQKNICQLKISTLLLPGKLLKRDFYAFSVFFRIFSKYTKISKYIWFPNHSPLVSRRNCAVCLVIQLCLTLCNPMDCSLPGASVHGNSPGKNTAVGSHALPPGDLPNPAIEPKSPILQADSSLSEPPGKPRRNRGSDNNPEGNLSLSQVKPC